MAARFSPLDQSDPVEIAGYALRARLGSGGMGNVYLSFTRGGRPVALKVIRKEFADDAEFRRRFRQEVTSAQRVQGLFTAPVLDADPDAAIPWLATAYIAGPSLAQAVVEHGPFPMFSVYRLLGGVAEGLSSVHAAGLVHRDLKPANVLLAEDGPRVIDFGIAHAADASALTGTGAMIGTPAFMAPEQVSGRPVSPATDVFALAHLVGYAATGHPVFGDGHMAALVYRIANEEPAIDDCPDALRPILARCLAKNPAARPGLAEVMEFSQQMLSGHTHRLMAASWLPDPVASNLSAYNSAALPPPAAPQPSAPGSAAPGSAAPGSAVPGSGPSGGAVPGSGMPGSHPSFPSGPGEVPAAAPGSLPSGKPVPMGPGPAPWPGTGGHSPGGRPAPGSVPPQAPAAAPGTGYRQGAGAPPWAGYPQRAGGMQGLGAAPGPTYPRGPGNVPGTEGSGSSGYSLPGGFQGPGASTAASGAGGGTGSGIVPRLRERGLLRPVVLVPAAVVVVLVIVVAAVLSGSGNGASPGTAAGATAGTGNAGPSGSAGASAAGPGSAAAVSSTSYSTPEPFPLCDPNGAQWKLVNLSPQSAAGCTQGMRVAASSAGYSFASTAQFPHGVPLTADNTVTVSGSLPDSAGGYHPRCLGAVEGSAATGYLGMLCNSGQWVVDTIAGLGSDGVIVGKQVASGSVPFTGGTPYNVALGFKSGTGTLTITLAKGSASPLTQTFNAGQFTPAAVGYGLNWVDNNLPINPSDFYPTVSAFSYTAG